MADTFTLQIPVSKVESVKAEAEAQGIDLAKAYGTLPETHGVILDYQVSYVDSGAVIQFTVKHKPPPVSVGMIESRVKGLLGL